MVDRKRPPVDVRILSQIVEEAVSSTSDPTREGVGIAFAQYRINVLHLSKKRMARRLSVSETDLMAFETGIRLKEDKSLTVLARIMKMMGMKPPDDF